MISHSLLTYKAMCIFSRNRTSHSVSHFLSMKEISQLKSLLKSTGYLCTPRNSDDCRTIVSFNLYFSFLLIALCVSEKRSNEKIKIETHKKGFYFAPLRMIGITSLHRHTYLRHSDTAAFIQNVKSWIASWRAACYTIQHSWNMLDAFNGAMLVRSVELNAANVARFEWNHRNG